MDDKDKEIQRAVAARYEAIARAFARGERQGCGCAMPEAESDVGSADELSCCSGASCGPARSDGAPGSETQESGLGCARIGELVRLFPGEALLDIGSGPGLETIALARRVEPAMAFGIDSSPVMVEVATENARKAGAANARFLNGSMEDIPLEDGSVDVVVSNCVINLSSRKERVMEEIRRVLRPGGRLAIADMVWLGTPPAWLRSSAQAWVSCVGGALELEEYPKLLKRAGFDDVKVDLLHTVRVPERSPSSCCAGPVGGQLNALTLGSALIAARKPGTPDSAVEIRHAEPDDLDVLLRSLEAAALPTSGVRDHLADFLVAHTGDGKIVGFAGLERYPGSSLLRSVVVLPGWRGRGVGRRLVASQLERVPPGAPVYLLTPTAEAYFRTLGFETIPREEVSPEIMESTEFRGACPHTAAVMRLARRKADQAIKPF